jgi:hypothetical protein
VELEGRLSSWPMFLAYEIDGEITCDVNAALTELQMSVDKLRRVLAAEEDAALGLDLDDLADCESDSSEEEDIEGIIAEQEKKAAAAEKAERLVTRQREKKAAAEIKEEGGTALPLR